ncbi:MAG: glycosyltransferase family 4 protein [Weeksellaceae bacterium]
MKQMTIGIDISQIVYEGSGVSRFTQGLCESILEYEHDHTWQFFFSSLRKKLPADLKQKIKQSRHILIEYPLPPTVISYLWNDLHQFTGQLAQRIVTPTPCDWFITSDWTEPMLNTKKATIVHDLVFRKYPETVAPKILKTQTKRLEWIAKETSLIITDSEQTAADLKEYYPTIASTVETIYPGVSIKEIDRETQISILDQLDLKDTDFILSVGKQEPRKNIDRLIQAYSQVKAKHKPLLVIVGMHGWGDTTVTSDPNIRFVNFVDDNTLHTLYSKAQFFVMPSLYEGFGYPVVEAMLHGCPTAVSNNSSLKEIGHTASYFFDPLKQESITSALQALINDPTLRKELAAKGLKRSTQYSWQKYYTALIKQLESHL